MSLPATLFDAAVFQAIIFDMDDTLYPERDFVLSGFAAVAAWADGALGIPQADGYALLAQLFADGVRGDTFNRWLAVWGVANVDGVLPQLVAVYRDHEPRIRPFPEVPALLAHLQSTYRLGLLSDGYLAVQQRKLAALGLASCFEAIVFSDKWGRENWKPAKRPFEAVLDGLAIEAAAVVYIADNPTKDFLGARQAGMKSIRLRHREGVYTDQEAISPAYRPDFEVNDVTALARLLGAGVRL